MSKVLLVSFFKSNNLGDLALSNAIEKLIVSKGYELIKYDFATVLPQIENKKAVPHDKLVNTNEHRSFKYSTITFAKKIIFFILGQRNVALLRYKLMNLLFPSKWRRLEEMVKEVDILVLGGGNMLMDITPTWPDTFGKYVLLAKKHNKEIYVIYIGAGPIQYERSKKIYRIALKNVKEISVRDPLSKRVCNQLINEKPIIETLDPVFSLPIDMLDFRLRSISDQNVYINLKIGISVLGEVCFDSKTSYREYLNNLSKLVTDLLLQSDKKIEIVLFSTDIVDYTAVYQFRDILISNNYNEVKIIKIKEVGEIIELYKTINFLIGGRMHGLIFAQKCLLPFIGIVWQNKIKGFAQVTKSSNRIYEIDELNKNGSYISTQILLDSASSELVGKMNHINNTLNERVLKGSIL